MEEIIKIRIAADLSELEQSGTKGAAALSALEATLGKTTTKLASFTSSLKAYGANAGVVAQNSKQISEALKTVTDSAGKVNIRPIKISTEVEKITVPDVKTKPVRIQAEVEKVVIPTTAQQAVKVPLEAGKLTIPQPSIPKINIPVNADTADLTAKLNAASRSIKINLDTAAALAKVDELGGRIAKLQSDIQGRKISLPLVADAANAQSEITELQAELTRLQSKLNTVKPVIKVAAEVQKVTFPTVTPKPIEVPLKAERIDLPTVKPPAVLLPVVADTLPLTNELKAATAGYKIDIDTTAAQQKVSVLETTINQLQAEIASKRTSLPLLTDTTSAQREIKDLEGELTRLQGSLANIKPVIIPIKASEVVIDAPTVPKVTVPVTGDVSELTTQLRQAERPVRINISTDTAVASVGQVESLIDKLQTQIESKRATLPLLADTTVAQGEIRELEKELGKLQSQFNATQFTDINISAHIDKDAARQEMIALLAGLESASPLQIETVVGKIDLPETNIPPIPIPVKVEVPKPPVITIAPVEVPLNTREATTQLTQLQRQVTAFGGGVRSFTLPNLRPVPPAVPASIIATTRAVAASSSATQRSGRDFTGLSRVLQDLPFGFLGIQNNITQLLPAAGGLGLAISAVTAALTFSQVGFGAWTRGLGGATASLDAYQQVAENSIKSTAESTAKLELIRAKLTDVNISQNQRITLAKEYNETADKANQIDLKQIDNIGLTNAAINRQISLLANRAKARAAEAILAEKYEKLFATQNEFNANFSFASEDEIKRNLDTAKNVIDAGFKSLKITPPKGIDIKQIVDFADIDTVTLSRLAQTNDEIKVLLNDRTRATLSSIGKQLRSIQDYRTGVQGMGSGVTMALGNIEGAQKEVNEALNAFNGLLDTSALTTGKEIKAPKIEQTEFNFFDKWFDAAPEKAKIEKQLAEMYETARDYALKNKDFLKGLEPILSAPDPAAAVAAGKVFWENYRKGFLEFKLPKLTPVIQVEPTYLAPDLRSEGEKFSALFGPRQEVIDMQLSFDREKILKDFQLQFLQLGRDLPATIGVPDPITGIVQQVDIKGVFNVSNLTNGLKGAKDATLQGIKDLNTAIDTASKSIAVGGFVAVGEAIAGAISGDGIGSAFAALGNLIGNALQSLGAQMIALAPVMTALKTSIKTFDPTGGILSGIALIAIGGIIKNSLKVPGLKEGGIIPPGFSGDKFFARLNSGEAVIPLDRLNSIIGITGNQPVYVTQRLRGRDSILQITREQKSQRRGG